ncbi:MAG: spermidine synthase, partial [Desulfobacteraceae bacterium]|nr:spermidine synthase [Desulfobacteraceae bacterium]
MDPLFKELDCQQTRLGELSLRRRRLLQLDGREIYEVKLGEHFLMSSLFHEAETQMAKISLAMVSKPDLNVVVGGLGLGYTTAAALADSRVTSLVVVEYLEPVILWHHTQLVPLGKELSIDPRCRMVHDDFFARSRDVDQGFDPALPGKKQDIILLDIDHTPNRVLHQTNTRFYTPEGLRELAGHLTPGGVFALWSDDPPEKAFTDLLESVFPKVQAHTISFKNPFTGGMAENAVYA